MRIAIVDDELVFARQTEKTVQDFFSQRQIAVTTRIFRDGIYLTPDIDERKNYDIYVLNVQMPGMGGFEIAERIRRCDQSARIIFVASFEKFAIEGYRYQASGYVLKDKCAEQLPKVLDRIVQENGQDEEAYYMIQHQHKRERFRIKDIIYLHKDGKHVVFYCRKDASYRERATLEEVRAKIPTKEFMCINRGEMVNLRHVTGMKNGYIELYEIRLPVSRNLLSEVKQTLRKYWGEDK